MLAEGMAWHYKEYNKDATLAAAEQASEVALLPGDEQRPRPGAERPGLVLAYSELFGGEGDGRPELLADTCWRKGLGIRGALVIGQVDGRAGCVEA